MCVRWACNEGVGRTHHYTTSPLLLLLYVHFLPLIFISRVSLSFSIFEVTSKGVSIIVLLIERIVLLLLLLCRSIATCRECGERQNRPSVWHWTAIRRWSAQSSPLLQRRRKPIHLYVRFHFHFVITAGCHIKSSSWSWLLFFIQKKSCFLNVLIHF